MFKKVVIASAILAATSSLAFADGVPYVGADLGLNSNTFKLKNDGGDKTNFSSSGVNGGLFAGYGVTVSNNIYLGGEAFLNGGSISTSTKAINIITTAKIKTTYSYGLDFVPGYKITDSTMAYAKVGVVRTRFNVTETQFGTQYTTRNTVVGGRFGLGVQTAVAKNVDVRGEFIHTSYNSFTTFGDRINPDNNQLNLGVVYKFG